MSQYLSYLRTSQHNIAIAFDMYRSASIYVRFFQHGLFFWRVYISYVLFTLLCNTFIWTNGWHVIVVAANVCQNCWQHRKNARIRAKLCLQWIESTILVSMHVLNSPLSFDDFEFEVPANADTSLHHHNAFTDNIGFCMQHFIYFIAQNMVKMYLYRQTHSPFFPSSLFFVFIQIHDTFFRLFEFRETWFLVNFFRCYSNSVFMSSIWPRTPSRRCFHSFGKFVTFHHRLILHV